MVGRARPQGMWPAGSNKAVRPIYFLERGKLTRSAVLALTLAALGGCGKGPTAHEALTACYTQLNAQTPDWRKHAAEPKMKVLVDRYMVFCMRDQHFNAVPRCRGTTRDERCYTRQAHFWDRF